MVAEGINEKDFLWTLWEIVCNQVRCIPRSKSMGERIDLAYLPQCRASLVVQTVKHLPAMQETWVQSLGWEDPLEKEMTTHSSTLAWKIPWMMEPGRLQSMGSQRVRHN